jgi:chromate transporter
VARHPLGIEPPALAATRSAMTISQPSPSPGTSEEPILDALPNPSLTELFLAFAKTGLTSFGGSVASWLMLEVVGKRRWVTDQEFLTGLAVSQTLPGVNILNLSIWLGYRMRGAAGAAASALGMVLPATVLAVVLVALFSRLLEFDPIKVSLGGTIAAAIGLSLAMSGRAIRNLNGDVAAFVIVAVMVVALFVFQLPLLPVLLVAAPVSIGFSFWRMRREGR